jgi:crotonobetainyl-CoA:carnitine CoA-transferase CaiB-like acyl-CoA transferase
MTTGQQSMPLPLPLEGLRVLDVTHIVAGPFCSMILADMGAEVIKVERPGAGERSRINTPFIEGSGEHAGGKVSARYLGVNRNKKSVSMDLRDPRCKQAFLSMARSGDVLLDNWGPGALTRLGLGYQELSEVNPGLVYASLTGYGAPEGGATGPYTYWPANNPCVQGMGGWMETTGASGGPPQMVGDNIGDSVPGVWTALGIMMALESRRKTGRGQLVDMAMYDCMMAHTTSSMPLFQTTGEVSSRARENMFSAQLVLKAQDGYVVLAGAGDQEKWVALWKLLGRDELIADPRYLGLGISGQFYFDHIVPTIEEWSQNLPKLEVTEKLTQIGFSMGMVQNVADLDRCPHLEARGMFVDFPNTVGGEFRAANTPIRLVGCVDTPAGAPPLVGEHNQEILCGIGGLSPGDLEKMQADGVV